MPEPVDVMLVGGTVVTMDEQEHIYPDGAVAVRGRDIVAVGPAADLVERYAATEVRDCQGCAIIPGLINGHAHVPMSLLRGMVADHQQLDVWLFGYMFPVESEFVDPEFSYVGTLLSAAEMLRGGTTTFVDMYYFEEEVARAVDSVGMRAICGQTVMRMRTPDASSYDEGLARTRRFLEQWHGHERIVPTIAPHAPYTCTDEIYEAAAALCAEYGVPLITHLSETAREVQESRDEREATPIGYADRVGAFGVPCIAAHCVHATEDDILLLRERGVGAVPCPESNLKLASGIAPYHRLIQAGVHTGIGTDGAASNDDQDMFTEIRFAAMLPKGVTGDPTVVPAREAFSLATSRAARAVHLSHLIGSLEPGKRADIVVVELEHLHSAPRYTYSPQTIYTHLVYSSRAADVRDVLVDGRWLLRDQELLTLNEQQVVAQAKSIAERINTFLSGREANLLDKIIGIGGVQQAEIFELQVKAHMGEDGSECVQRMLAHPAVQVTKTSERRQYDTYFIFEQRERGRIRIREDHRLDPGARPEPKYTITLMEEARRGDYPFAILLSRARYTASADRTLRFYREYFHPDHEEELEKHRQRWRILYQDVDFAINFDTLVDQSDPGPYLEIKSRTWGRRDADERARLIGELLALCGIDDSRLVKQEYIEIKARTTL
jgi:5-methylthioadenosine/S-adenosylhomocysteine deaminase